MTGLEILKVTGITRLYGEGRGIFDASLTVRRSEIAGLVGANGAGKTTLIRAIVGLTSAASGSVQINGFDIQQAPVSARHQFGFVPDTPDVLDKITVWELLRFVGLTYNLSRTESEERGESLLDLLGLHGAKHQLMGSLSHGMRKKVQIAAALLHRPPLLIMDEPTNGLDPLAILLLRDILRAAKAAGQGVLVATHNLGFADELCDTVMIIDRSQVAVYGPIEDLKRQYACSTLDDLYLKVVGGGAWGDKIAQVMGYQ